MGEHKHFYRLKHVELDSDHTELWDSRFDTYYFVCDRCRHLRKIQRCVMWPKMKPKGRQMDPSCLDKWEEAFSGGFNPACCRFPKPCSIQKIARS